MKRIIMSIAAVLLLASMLASCVSEVATSTPTAEPTATETGAGTPTPEATPDATTPEESATPTPEPVETDPYVLLKDKRAFFFGDSICAAAVYDGKGSRYGWPGRIKDEYGLKESRNCGGDGAAVSDKGPTDPPLQIHKQLLNNQSSIVDFVILEGGVNDAWANVEVGQMVEASPEDTKIEDLDCDTFAGGLERLLSIAKKQYPNAKIGYIICYKLSHPAGRLNDMTEYVEMTKKICDKWGVPYLNLYEDKAFNTKFLIKLKKNAVDGCHPNENGYDLLAPVIAEFMAEIAVG